MRFILKSKCWYLRFSGTSTCSPLYVPFWMGGISPWSRHRWSRSSSDDVALFVLANIRIVKSLWRDTAALKILIHPAFIASGTSFGYLYWCFVFTPSSPKLYLIPGEIEQLLTSLKVGHPLVNKHVKDVIVSGASAETMERKCFSVIYKRGVVFLMEGAASTSNSVRQNPESLTPER